ncbi:MAG: HAMP domain-containing histidine kinase, partial [Burkholderiales bacterium]|nr:HAMP domain-containing histidine kinase [Burkholderiales bacterium]
ALFQPERGKIVWPPPDLAQTQVSLQVLAPGEGAETLFDSASPVAEAPFALGDLSSLLAAGERLTVRRAGSQGDVLALTGKTSDEREIAPWIARLIRLLPVEGYDAPIALSETMATSNGRYELALSGNVRSVNRTLAAVATRLSWFVGAMLAAIVLAWALIELRIIRRITLLTRRAASVSSGMRAADGLAHIDLKDLRGGDELGVLAQGLSDLLARVNDDVRREHIRAQQEKDQWHAVGHEIMSPLQSLMALHGAPDDPSHRYIGRMQQAVRVLYGQASPSEALAGSTLALAPLNLTQFLAHVAANADAVGIADVRFEGPGADVRVQADEYALEDVVTHVLRNAERHRTPGSAIRIVLSLADGLARVDIVNQGKSIDPELLDKVFEYGVSSQANADGAQRGQGLFVARTYLAKMGGTIAALNVDGGVCLRLELPRSA